MFLAWAEIRRARLRFALLIGAVGLLVFLVLFVEAIAGNLTGKFTGALDRQSADVLVYGADARNNLEGSRVSDAQVPRVRRVAGVAGAAPLGEGTFSVEAGGATRDAVLFGHRPGGPGEPAALAVGRAVAHRGEAVASSGSAGEGFALGDVVRVLPDGERLRIVGLVDDANYAVLPVLFVPYSTYVAARRTVNPDARMVPPSAVAVWVANGMRPGDVARRIDADVPGVQALTRTQAVERSPGVRAVRQSLSVVSLLFFLVVPVVIGLFLLIVTVQKTASLTLLRALGVPASALVRAVLVQVAIVLGGGVAVALVLLYAAGGLLESAGAATGVALPVGTAAGIVGALIGLSALALVPTVRRLRRIDPHAAVAGAGIE